MDSTAAGRRPERYRPYVVIWMDSTRLLRETLADLRDEGRLRVLRVVKYKRAIDKMQPRSKHADLPQSVPVARLVEPVGEPVPAKFPQIGVIEDRARRYLPEFQNPVAEANPRAVGVFVPERVMTKICPVQLEIGRASCRERV